jgi:chromosome segregation ATPase
MGWRDFIYEKTAREAAGATLAVKPATPFQMPTTVNDEMVAAIKKATLGRKTPYTALLEASEKLLGVIPDAVTRLKAAYAMVGTESRSVGQISKAIDLHISDADGERLRFMQASKQKRDAEIGSLQSTIATQQAEFSRLQKEQEDLQKRLQDVQAGMAMATAAIQSATSEVSTREAEISKVEQQFDEAAKQVKNEFEEQRRVILSTLK